MKAVGSIFEPDDRTMWLHDPHVPVEMTKAQSEEWSQLIQEAGLAGSYTPAGRKPWWRFW